MDPSLSPASLIAEIQRLLEAGQAQSAVDAATAFVDRVLPQEEGNPAASHAIGTALGERARIRAEYGDPEGAHGDYLAAIERLELAAAPAAETGRLHAALAPVLEVLGRHERAVVHWQLAVGCLELATPPPTREIAGISNHLGLISKNAGDFDSAETHFLKALEILHDSLGPEDETTAAVADNVGVLYQTAGYHEQAVDFLNMALDSRRARFGDEHPDSARSHHHLAITLLATGDRSWARRHFEKAFSGFEALGPEHASELAAVAEAYCAVLREDGEGTMAEKIESGVRDLLAEAAR